MRILRKGKFWEENEQVQGGQPIVVNDLRQALSRPNQSRRVYRAYRGSTCNIRNAPYHRQQCASCSRWVPAHLRLCDRCQDISSRRARNGRGRMRTGRQFAGHRSNMGNRSHVMRGETGRRQFGNHHVVNAEHLRDVTEHCLLGLL